MRDSGESFYRPQKWLRPKDQQSRLAEIRQYLINEQHRESPWEITDNGLIFKPQPNPVYGEVSLETASTLLGLSCSAPYKRELIPTKEESEILYLEDLFNQPEVRTEAKNETQRYSGSIPEALESTYESGRRRHNVGNWNHPRRDGEAGESGSPVSS